MNCDIIPLAIDPLHVVTVRQSENLRTLSWQPDIPDEVQWQGDYESVKEYITKHILEEKQAVFLHYKVCMG